MGGTRTQFYLQSSLLYCFFGQVRAGVPASAERALSDEEEAVGRMASLSENGCCGAGRPDPFPSVVLRPTRELAPVNPARVTVLCCAGRSAGFRTVVWLSRRTGARDL